MARIVQKFGGTSVADLDHIRAAAGRVKAEMARGNQVAVVISAMAGSTSRLAAWAIEAAPLHDAREYDAVLASGEQVTAGLMAISLQELGVDARSWLGWQIPIRTDGAHGKARIQAIETAELERRMAARQVPVIAGFQGLGPDSALCPASGEGATRWRLERPGRCAFRSGLISP